MEIVYNQNDLSLEEFVTKGLDDNAFRNEPTGGLSIVESNSVVDASEHLPMRLYVGFIAVCTLAMSETVAVSEAVQHNNATTGALAGVGAATLFYALTRHIKNTYDPFFAQRSSGQ